MLSSVAKNIQYTGGSLGYVPFPIPDGIELSKIPYSTACSIGFTFPIRNDKETDSNYNFENI